MTNLLSLIRRKVTYIYIAILSAIIIIVLIFFSFYDYYNQVINDMFAKNGYVFVISRNDYTEELNEYDNLISINDGIVFKPNFDDKFIVPLSLESNSNTDEEDILFWEELLPGGYDRIPVFDYDENLGKNEVILYQSIISHTDEEVSKIINNEISLYFNDELISLKIKNVEKKSKRGMKISKELFDELLKKQKIYVKKINVSNFYTAMKIVDDFYEKEKNIDYVSSYEELYLEDESEMIYNFRNIIDSLNIASIVLICLFIFIYVLIINNCIADQSENIKIKRFLGYKKKKIKFEMIKCFLIITVTVYFIGSLLSNLLILLLNGILNYNIQYIKLLLLIKLAGVTSILTIVLILLFNIKDFSKGGDGNEV